MPGFRRRPPGSVWSVSPTPPLRRCRLPDRGGGIVLSRRRICVSATAPAPAFGPPCPAAVPESSTGSHPSTMYAFMWKTPATSSRGEGRILRSRSSLTGKRNTPLLPRSSSARSGRSRECTASAELVTTTPPPPTPTAEDAPPLPWDCPPPSPFLVTNTPLSARLASSRTCTFLGPTPPLPPRRQRSARPHHGAPAAVRPPCSRSCHRRRRRRL